MKTLIITSILSILFTTLNSQAEYTGTKCSHELIASGEVLINRQWNEDKGLCFIDIHPMDTSNLYYRDYYFDSEGHFMVFNSYGDGPDSQTTGFRDFYLFPKALDYPDFSVEPDGNVLVKTVSGHVFKFSAKDFSIISISDAHFTEKPLSSSNKGGVEIQLTKGFWLDGGFAKGTGKLSNPQNQSVFYNSQKLSKNCSLKNKLIFNYPEAGDFVLKYPDANDMNSFLKKQCPQLF